MSVHLVFQVRGLCGTLTWNQHDDFTTPEGDVENSVPSFARKFTTEHCALPRGAPLDPCTTYTQRRHYAETVCAVIHSHIFQVGVEGGAHFIPTCLPINKWMNNQTITVLYERPSRQLIHTVQALIHTSVLTSSSPPSLLSLLEMSRCGGQGAICTSMSFWSLWMCSTEGLPLHRPHSICSTLCTGGRDCPLAQPHLLP